MAKVVNPDGSAKVKVKNLSREEALRRAGEMEAQIERIEQRLPNYENENPARAERAKTFRDDLKRSVAAIRRKFPE